MGRIVRFGRDLRRRWQASGAMLTAMLIVGLASAIGIAACSQFATTGSGPASLLRIMFGPRVSAQPITARPSRRVSTPRPSWRAR